MTFNKWKAGVMALAFISTMSLLFSIGVHNKQKRYMEEDMKQFIREINYSITNSKVVIDNIISDKEEIYMDNKDVKLLMIYHRDLNRNIFDFKKKSRFINSELGSSFQQLWDNYNFNEQINDEDIRLYYEQLSKRADSNGDILLNDDDVNMFQEIMNFFYKIRKDINKLIGEEDNTYAKNTISSQLIALDEPNTDYCY